MMLSIILKEKKGMSADELQRGFTENIPSRVTNPEATRLDTTNSSGTDNEDTLLLGLPEDLTSVALGHTLSNQGKSLDLGELEALKSARVHTTRAGKVDNNVDIGVLGDGLLERGVDGQEGLFGSPVELLDVVATEGVDHGSDGGSLATARVVKVQHALDGTGLETIDERAGVSIEWPERGAGSGALGVEVDEKVGGLSALSIGVDRTQSIVGLTSSGDLGRRSLGLNRLQAVETRDAGLGLADIDAKGERNDLSDVGVGTEDTNGDA
jgi:hypothetical protein